MRKSKMGKKYSKLLLTFCPGWRLSLTTLPCSQVEPRWKGTEAACRFYTAPEKRGCIPSLGNSAWCQGAVGMCPGCCGDISSAGYHSGPSCQSLSCWFSAGKWEVGVESSTWSVRSGRAKNSSLHHVKKGEGERRQWKSVEEVEEEMVEEMV